MSADKPWKIIGIDPSSTITGYAVLLGVERCHLVEAGLIRGRVSKEGRHEMDPAVVHQLHELPALERTLSMVPDIFRLIGEHAPCHVVVEMPSGKAGTGSKRGASGSLTSYGMAAGLLFATCNFASEMANGLAVPVSERVWTQNQTDKVLRGRVMGTIYGWKHPSEWYEKDVNLNITDAIGIARWAIITGILTGRGIVSSPSNHPHPAAGDGSRVYWTTGRLAAHFSTPVHRIVYLIRARHIKPVGRAGAAHVYDDAAVSQIEAELRARSKERHHGQT